MADTADLKSASFGSTGSSPVSGTNFSYRREQCLAKIRQPLGIFAFPALSFLFAFVVFASAKTALLTILRVALASLRHFGAMRLVESHLGYQFSYHREQCLAKIRQPLGKFAFPPLSHTSSGNKATHKITRKSVRNLLSAIR